MTVRRSVFIAHARADRDIAAFFDDLGPTVGEWSVIRVPVSEDWWTSAQKCIHACDAFVFVDTEAARISRWCLQELAAAEAARRPVRRITREELWTLADMLARWSW
ncbi:hypothetical protein Q9R32_05020 [Actinotalea sp. AC32]|nr:hypothetical protein [Actinotalea sp. AC32]